MRKGILNKISIILDPFVYLAEVGASKAKEWRNDSSEDIVLNHSKKPSKINKKMIDDYVAHCNAMDDMMDRIFNR